MLANFTIKLATQQITVTAITLYVEGDDIDLHVTTTGIVEETYFDGLWVDSDFATQLNAALTTVGIVDMQLDYEELVVVNGVIEIPVINAAACMRYIK